MAVQDEVTDVEVKRPAAQPPATAMTVRQATALAAIGGHERFPLAELSEDAFASLLERLEIHYKRIKQIQRSQMKAGVHYGIPGKTPAQVIEALKGDGTKVGLYKPGMELLLKIHNYVADVKQTMHYGDPTNVDSPAIRVETLCYIHAGSLDGPIIAVGVGSANSWETKHRYRNAQRKCPDCHQPRLVFQKVAKGGPNKGSAIFWCGTRDGGCGNEFLEGDTRITGQELGRVANADAYDLENTLVKMSAKRGKVDGTITATGSSDLFTQDVEDLTPGAPANMPEGDAGDMGWYGDREQRTETKAETTTKPASKPVAVTSASDKQVNVVRMLLKDKRGCTNAREMDATLVELGVEGGLPGLTNVSAGAVIDTLQKEDARTAKPAPKPVPGEGMDDTENNREILRIQARGYSNAMLGIYTGRNVIQLVEGVYFVTGANELALLAASSPVQLEYLDVKQLQLLNEYLRGEVARKGKAA